MKVTRKTTESKITVTIGDTLTPDYRKKIRTPSSFLNHMIEHIAYRFGRNIECELELADFTLDHLVFEDLDCKNLTSKVSGSGDITLKGKADEARYSVSGSGDIKAYDLSVNDLSCSVSGSGDARVYAKDNMNLSVSGSGDIRYKGPANVNKSKSGSGSIQVRIDRTHTLF